MQISFDLKISISDILASIQIWMEVKKMSRMLTAFEEDLYNIQQQLAFPEPSILLCTAKSPN